MKWTCHRCLPWVGSVLLTLTLLTLALAQEPPPIQYVYDELGRLVKVIDQDGNMAEYVYDAVGNILEIRRATITGLAILSFAPARGTVETTVTIQGQGFRTTPSENVVAFNGTAASVLSATSTGLVVTVPPGATTGPITVTVAGTSAVSDHDFLVLVLPGITSLHPIVALSGTVLPDVQVQGNNLMGATFTFVPTLTPPALTVTSATIAADGTAATVQVTVRETASGSFVLVATNTVGSSSQQPSAANTLRILAGNADDDLDGLTNADELARGTNPLHHDSDGDGFSDGMEVEGNTDPTDPQHFPILRVGFAPGGPGVSVLNTTEAVPQGVFTVAGAPVAVLNTTAPTPQGDFTTSGAPVAILNITEAPPQGDFTASGAPVAILNTTAPTPQGDFTTSGAPVAILNITEAPPQVGFTVGGAPVAVLNTTAPMSEGGFATGLTISVLNAAQ